MHANKFGELGLSDFRDFALFSNLAKFPFQTMGP